MKKKIIIFLLTISFVINSLAEQNQKRDSLIRNKVYSYLYLIEKEPVQTKEKELDFLILSTKDSILRQQIALSAYDYYSKSKLMGDEAVLVYLFDNWFANHKIKMSDDYELARAKLFADINRSSLIGKLAKPLQLRDSLQNKYTLFSQKNLLSDSYRILYFYDVNCPKCSLETIKLTNFLSTFNSKIELSAIYVGSNLELWADYRRKFDNLPKTVKLQHLYDNDLESDFIGKYGVLSTPKMFLIDKNAKIIGRNLTTSALSELLSQLHFIKPYIYGDDKAIHLFDKYFKNSDNNRLVKDYTDFLEAIKTNYLDIGKSLEYKYLVGDFLYYLSSQKKEEAKNFTLSFINNYIEKNRYLWSDNQQDSLSVLALSDLMKNLAQKSPIGSKVADIQVYGRLVGKGRLRILKYFPVKTKRYSLRSFSYRSTYLYFYTENCRLCKDQRAKIANLLKYREKILFINVDDMLRSYPNLSKALFENFDLSSLPHIIKLDNHSIIEKKNISL